MATLRRTFAFSLAGAFSLAAASLMAIILRVGVAHEEVGPLHPEIDRPAVIMPLGSQARIPSVTDGSDSNGAQR